MSDSRQLQAPPVRCASCGQLDTGTYCSACGNRLDGRRSALRDFVETFAKLGEWKGYLTTFLRLLLRPTRNTLRFAAEKTPRQAFRFLEVSVVLFVVASLSQDPAFDLGPVGDIFLPAYIVAAWFLFLTGFYALARLASPRGVAFAEFTHVAALYLGFVTPWIALLSLLESAGDAGAVAGLGVLLGLAVYTVRLWARFWQIGRLRVLLCLGLGYVGLAAGAVALVAAGGRRLRAAA